MIIQKSYAELKKMRQAGRIVAETFEFLEEKIRPGVTTKALEKLAESCIKKRGGWPAFKNYQGFPAAICISLNEGVVHGIPSSRELKAGDIVSIDIGVRYQGYYGDGAVTFPVGKVSNEAQKLIETTQKALAEGIKKCQIGNHLYDISFAIEEVAKKAGYSVVRDFVGHGIGSSLHEDPQVPNYGEKGKGPLLEEGMVLALEPMINEGGFAVEVLSDQWGVVTKDRSLSAHFEHTVAVSAQGPQILTCL